jgi:hypothetical protein
MERKTVERSLVRATWGPVAQSVRTSCRECLCEFQTIQRSLGECHD